jgi:hypothetical protein
MQAPSRTLSIKPIFPSPPSPPASGMKFAFEIKTETVTQAAVIVAVIAFSSGFLATIAVYAQSPTISVTCAVALAIIVCLALRFLLR